MYLAAAALYSACALRSRFEVRLSSPRNIGAEPGSKLAKFATLRVTLRVSNSLKQPAETRKPPKWRLVNR